MRDEGRVVRFALILMLLALPAPAAQIEGVNVPDKVRLGEGGPELVLNGAGLRTRVFFKVYVGALYLQQKKTSADAVLADTGPRRIAMHLLRELTAEQLFPRSMTA
jgi:long-chain acyl-CoA synthetase